MSRNDETTGGGKFGPAGGRKPGPAGGRKPGPTGGRKPGPTGGRKFGPTGGRRPGAIGGRKFGATSARGHRGIGKLAAAAVLGVVVTAAAACGSERTDERIIVVTDPAPERTAVTGAPADERLTVVPSHAEAPAAEEPDPGSTPTRPDSFAVPQVTFGDAERVFRTGDYGKAAELFEAYATRMPSNPWGHYMLGISAWRDGDHVRAEAALRRTIEVDATHLKGQLNLARVLLEQRKASDALDFALQVVELDPWLGEGWRVLGNAHAELNMAEAAADAYRRAIVLSPEDAWTMNNLGLLRIQQGDYEAALPPLARATELRPEVAVFQNNLGVALERGGYLTHAAEAFRAALATDAQYDKARVSLERVEARGPSGTPAPLEIAALAAVFADDVRGWQAESRGADGGQP